MGQRSLYRTSLIRLPYRTLLSDGHAYAAFSKSDLSLLDEFQPDAEVLDPTSGYGLAEWAAERGLASFCVELNPPQYLWQVLTCPSNASFFAGLGARCAEAAASLRTRLPRATASNGWLPEPSQDLIRDLLSVVVGLAESSELPDGLSPHRAALAVLLPFAGRLTANVAGDVSHVKRGGICVYKDWKTDFRLYADALSSRLGAIAQKNSGRLHTVVLADSRRAELPSGDFDAMLTSPPYPNRTDYGDMFGPERAVLRLLEESGLVPVMIEGGPQVIGTNTVRGAEQRSPTGEAANEFLDSGDAMKLDKQAAYNWSVYYRPYYRNYFADIEMLYENVARHLAPRFKGYIVVANNSYRRLEVPVGEAVSETWQRMGFHVRIHGTREVFHVGTKNPRARGSAAKHATYALEVSR